MEQFLRFAEDSRELDHLRVGRTEKFGELAVYRYSLRISHVLGEMMHMFGATDVGMISKSGFSKCSVITRGNHAMNL